MPKASNHFLAMQQVAIALEVDPAEIRERTMGLLRHARHMAWLTEDVAADWHDRLAALTPGNGDGLLWLEHFAPPELRRRCFSDRDAIRRNRFLYRALCEAVRLTAHYPIHGATYRTILEGCYLAETPLRDLDLAEALYIERSTFYARKREAILCCALQLVRLCQQASAAPDLQDF